MEGRRILAIRAGALGDTILTLPALAALRRAVGRTGSLELAGREPYVQLVRSSEHAGRVHSIDRGMFRALYDERVDDRELRAFLGRFDRVVAWANLPLLRRKLSRSSSALEVSPFPQDGVHAAEHVLRTLSPLGIEGPIDDPRVIVTEEGCAGAAGWLGRMGLEKGSFVAIHPSSGSPDKNWPIDRFASVAERVCRAGRPLVWLSGEADGPVVRELVGRVPAPVAKDLPLPVLAAFLSFAAVYLGNDSGVSHLAAAVAVPTVTLFGPSDPRSWAPRGSTVVDFRESPERVWEKTLERIHAR